MIRLLRFLKPYRFSVVLIVLLVFAQAIANLLLPTLMADVIDEGVVKSDLVYIIRTGGLMLLVGLVAAAAAITASFFTSRTATGFARLLRLELFTRIEHFSLNEVNRIGTASLITRTTNDTTQVQQLLIILLNMMINAPLMGIGGIILAVTQGGDLAWILVATIPILAVALIGVMRYALRLFLSIQVKLDRLNLILDEKLKGVRVIRAFDRSEYEQQRFDSANEDLMRTTIHVNRVVAALLPAMTLVMNLASIAIVWFGGMRVNEGTMQIGNMMALLQYSMSILFSLLMVSMMFVMLPRASASASRINEVLALKPGIVDAPETQTANQGRGLVSFQHVTFKYPGAEEPAVYDLSFTTRPGELTAIIGGTGSGKSTLAHLLLRFYDVSQGQILVNGVDIRAIRQQDLRAKIGFVPQKPQLFSGSISENVRYGKKDATEAEIWHALQVAQAQEFVSALEAGLDSVVTQGGTNLSGGQKQRLAIARALVRQPEIYLFDDSFSALDFQTEARLRMALKEETREATVLLVTQRVSTAMEADRIIVLDEGRMVGKGTHQELMRSCEAYREIVATQLSLEELA
ncbi:ATP-binding cassette subfamily B protein [Thermosporothrix hazakensis]|jgi:ATP-binding cassette subfamily B protein|uniref:ATP-binding cassette subfamily B protein n=1 Tax=Thermosporothrix hazakensis TaxID=644383 RepID=A0A326U925_THEHA|nr:ABC transporter ATP-binding protein [Thermosporothrix hazakensis]PZW31907.1 ATP-binding cassette subfamily B protein [Thermosporothrix hazakensis]GCE49768.1 multidrug ABC transporter ATP-binding protein [Thermosporothrix hazakensis]